MTDFQRLFAEDQTRFKDPAGWHTKNIADSPLLTDFTTV